MTRATILLVLSLIALSVHASVNPQASANRFYGQLFEKYFAEAYEELFDLTYGKWDSFYPGHLKHEEIAELKKKFVAAFGNEGNTGLISITAKVDEVAERINKEMDERIELMNEEGRRFHRGEGKNKKILVTLKAEDMALEFSEFRKKYDVLSLATRASIEAQLPIYGKLPELQAHINVFDRVRRHAMKLSGMKS